VYPSFNPSPATLPTFIGLGWLLQARPVAGLLLWWFFPTAQSGWVFVGDVTRSENEVVIENAAVVRRWGTTA